MAFYHQRRHLSLLLCLPFFQSQILHIEHHMIHMSQKMKSFFEALLESIEWKHSYHSSSQSTENHWNVHIGDLTTGSCIADMMQCFATDCISNICKCSHLKAKKGNKMLVDADLKVKFLLCWWHECSEYILADRILLIWELFVSREGKKPTEQPSKFQQPLPLTL